MANFIDFLRQVQNAPAYVQVELTIDSGSNGEEFFNKILVDDWGNEVEIDAFPISGEPVHILLSSTQKVEKGSTALTHKPNGGRWQLEASGFINQFRPLRRFWTLRLTASEGGADPQAAQDAVQWLKETYYNEVLK